MILRNDGLIKPSFMGVMNTLKDCKQCGAGMKCQIMKVKKMSTGMAGNVEMLSEHSTLSLILEQNVKMIKNHFNISSKIDTEYQN